LIIGSGLSGLSCAQELFKITTNILVVDKGFLAGGRTASKMIKTPIGDATFDYGAQYFTVDELEFQKQVNDWMKSGTVQKWSTMFASSVEVEHRETKMRYCGSPTMRSVWKWRINFQ
ncbi:NAD(P)-binding protein, partial [Nodularia spumigena]|uniref:NAD(P)-binding protein n=1 Tax=Nodularia spumigena TaxID=70799 RepID=UPI002B1F5300